MTGQDKHAVHMCLSCSGRIEPDQPEERVTGKAGMIRYRHTRDADCSAALNEGSPHREYKAHKANLPGLDAMEEWQ